MAPFEKIKLLVILFLIFPMTLADKNPVLLREGEPIRIGSNTPGVFGLHLIHDRAGPLEYTILIIVSIVLKLVDGF